MKEFKEKEKKNGQREEGREGGNVRGKEEKGTMKGKEEEINGLQRNVKGKIRRRK